MSHFHSVSRLYGVTFPPVCERVSGASGRVSGVWRCERASGEAYERAGGWRIFTAFQVYLSHRGTLLGGMGCWVVGRPSVNELFPG